MTTRRKTPPSSTVPGRQPGTPASAPTSAPPAASRASSRRLLAAAAVVMLAAAAVAAWWLWPREAVLTVSRAADQNILIVTIDTLRADALGSYGGRAATPHLDALAADGVRYDFAHAHSVVTLPSHASILTGLYPFQHGVRENSGYRVPAGTQTLATMLKAQGFATGAFIGAFPLDSQFGLDAGFGVYDDQLNEVAGPADFAFSERPARAVVDAAMKWVQAQRGKWFLWVHVYDPHAPTRPPEPFATQYASDRYAGEVAFTDAALGPLVALARSSADRPTLVVVTGDHGEGLGDHGEATHGVFAYEATLRIPLIVAQFHKGGAASRGARPLVSPAAVQHVDLVPTVLDALGLPVPGGLPGKSLVGQTKASAAMRASYFEALTGSLNRGWAPLHGVLVDREKFIDLPLPELYDLAADPAEATNLVESQGDRRRRLEARLKEFGPTSPGERVVESGETAAKLRSLGYTSGSAAPRKAYTEDDDPKRLIALDQAMQRGIDAFQDGRPQEAAAIYSDVVAKRPGMGVAYLHLAFLQWELGRTADAVATLRTAREKAGEDAEIDSRLGMYLSELGEFREALPLLEHAAALPDAGTDALNALGITLARMGQGGRALEVFQRILTIDSRNVMAAQNIGSVHLSAGNLDAARAAFERAVELNPKWAPTYTGLGVVELRAGDRDAAIAAWRRAVELDPSDVDALFNLATELINARRNDEARPFAESFVRIAPRGFYARDIDRLQAWLARH